MILKKIFKAVLGASNEIGESIVSHQDIRIFEQELRELNDSISEAEAAQVNLLANKKLAENTIHDLKNKIESDSSAARQALSDGEKDLAEKIAQRIADNTNLLRKKEADLVEAESNYNKVAQQISQLKQNACDLDAELDRVKATESVQKVQKQMHSSLGSNQSVASSARESIDRIRERQAKEAARFDAASELDVSRNLDSEIYDNGYGVTKKATASSILEGLAKEPQE